MIIIRSFSYFHPFAPVSPSTVAASKIMTELLLVSALKVNWISYLTYLQRFSAKLSYYWRFSDICNMADLHKCKVFIALKPFSIKFVLFSKHVFKCVEMHNSKLVLNTWNVLKRRFSTVLFQFEQFYLFSK